MTSTVTRRMVGTAIPANNRRFTEAAARGAARAMASLYTADAELLPPNAGAHPVPGALGADP